MTGPSGASGKYTFCGFVTRISRPATSRVSAGVGTRPPYPWPGLTPLGTLAVVEEDAFETERLRLRPFAADLSDLDALHEIQSDARPHALLPASVQS